MVRQCKVVRSLDFRLLLCLLLLLLRFCLLFLLAQTSGPFMLCVLFKFMPFAMSRHFILLFLSSLLFILAISFCFCFDPFQLLVVASLKLLQLLYFLHSLIQHFPLLQYFIALILKPSVFLHHTNSSAIKLLILLPDFFSLLFFLFQLPLCIFPLRLQNLPLVHYP